jgi:signal transduction histidine kinase
LLDGEVELIKRVDVDDVVMIHTSQHGAYAGATRAFVLAEQQNRTYVNGLRAVRPTRFFEISADDFGAKLRAWFPMAVHLLDGLFLGLTNMEAIRGQREKLVALGSISAGLAHELNNPAAAAVRSAQAVRQRIGDAHAALAVLVPGLRPDDFPGLVSIEAEAVRRAAAATPLSSLEVGDLEDELGAWLDAKGVESAWEVSPVLASAGLDTDWLEMLAVAVGDQLGTALAWIAARLDANALVDELEDAATRISTLVGAIKEYSQMDRAPSAETDVHDGLESTLVMLGHKLKGGVEVVRDYDRTLPRIPARPSELNQVWTNLIDNAVDAMDGTGRLLVRTSLDGDNLVVEIGDTGPGIPPELQRRVFEPFYTTKPVGKGTGLGLDISYRIVVTEHRGDLRVESRPGDTRFQVRLPVAAGDGR